MAFIYNWLFGGGAPAPAPQRREVYQARRAPEPDRDAIDLSLATVALGAVAGAAWYYFSEQKAEPMANERSQIYRTASPYAYTDNTTTRAAESPPRSRYGELASSGSSIISRAEVSHSCFHMSGNANIGSPSQSNQQNSRPKNVATAAARTAVPKTNAAHMHTANRHPVMHPYESSGDESEYESEFEYASDSDERSGDLRRSYPESSTPTGNSNGSKYREAATADLREAAENEGFSTKTKGRLPRREKNIYAWYYCASCNRSWSSVKVCVWIDWRQLRVTRLFRQLCQKCKAEKYPKTTVEEFEKVIQRIRDPSQGQRPSGRNNRKPHDSDNCERCGYGTNPSNHEDDEE